MNTNDDLHIIPIKTLGLVLVFLFGLTVVTVGISRVDLGALNIWAALSIATLKCTLVLLYFMHLKYDNRLLTWGLIITLGFVAILIGFLFWDISYR